MTYFNRASFAPLKSTTPASIGTAYATIGTPLINPAVVLAFFNSTDGSVYVSTNGTDDMLLLAPNSFRVFDIRTNAMNLTNYAFQKGTQFYVKDGPTVGATGIFTIEIVQVTE